MDNDSVSFGKDYLLQPPDATSGDIVLGVRAQVAPGTHTDARPPQEIRMDIVDTRYAGHVFMQQASGTGPYFGRYRFVTEGSETRHAAWVNLAKSWPTSQLASDDAARAAHFAINAKNYCDASNRAIAAAAEVMTLDRHAAGWAAAVTAERVAAQERDILEGKLLGARELHWPEIRLHGRSATPLRTR